MTTDTAKRLSDLKARLGELRERLQDDPLSNPVRRLAHELSREIEAGRLTLDDTDAMVSTLALEAAEARKEHAERYLAPAGTLEGAVSLLTDGAETPEAYREALEVPRETIVFTGHPTFAMGPSGGSALSGDAPLERATEIRHEIDLSQEHGEACLALERAADAVVEASEAALKEAARRFGDAFRTMLPAPVGLATWVGYDLDGRQDIGWPRIVQHRLREKVLALEDYIRRLRLVPDGEGVSEVLRSLEEAHRRTERDYRAFASDEALEAPEGVAAAANLLTGDGPGRLTSLSPLIDKLVATASDLPEDNAVRLLAIASLMKLRGLGLGEIHFRLNASQIRNAAKAMLPLPPGADLFGHTALGIVGEAIEKEKGVRVNFASLAQETSSARRITITASQILKHIDADTPIRFLIAECENPVTVLTAIYLAKHYRAEERLDICPLFETAKSFDRSRRILSVLLEQPAFREQAERRGRVAIEAGFSDAGRFMGQLTATLAIERLQGQLADEMERQGIGHLAAIVFNTHGESMGRGGHPASILDRSRYVMSPWARRRFDEAGIALSHEISFQGGDGYSWFASPGRARAVVAGLLRASIPSEQHKDDPFYERSEASLDFYNTIRGLQIELFHEEAMGHVALGPGLALLPLAGSRKTKRQFEKPGEGDVSLRRIRAISHNGSLQQIGYVANIHGGLGEALGIEPEAYTELAATSDRFCRLMRLAARAAELSDMKTLIAYMKLYDGSFWATRPISGREPHLERACADLASHLIGDRRYVAALELAARLRPGAITLKRVLGAMGFTETGPAPLNLDLLHALRIALMEHMFLLGARLPSFARAGGFSRPEVLDEILALDVPAAVNQLREGFPQRSDTDIQSLFDEPADTQDAETGYAEIEHSTITPLERAYHQCKRISLAVAHHFGAHG